MQYVKLGATGIDVSRLCLGCMTYGEPTRGSHPWTLDEEQSRPLIRQAVEAGINFFDTANVYSSGSSEEITGRALKEFSRREEVVIATKVHGRMHPGPNGQGLSRKAILHEIDASLARLGTDYVDLYQIHRFDYETPVEVTLEALNDVVRAGKARYIGASSMFAWQFATMLHVAQANRWARFSTMQNYVSLLYREEEREMLPLCQAESIAVLPWSPLARGRLARTWQQPTRRAELDVAGRALIPATDTSDQAVVEMVGEIASERAVSRAQVALAWVLGRDAVTAPIIGVSKPVHLTDAIAALDLALSEEESARLEAPYEPHAVVGFS